MAMSVGGGGSAREPDVMIEINTTPLIDVMLVLLIMLIITIPIQLHTVTLNMPVSTPKPPTTPPEVVKLDIDANSKMFWNGNEVPDRKVLESLLAAEAAKPEQPELHLRPDRNAQYDVVAAVMVSANRYGLVKVGIVGSEQFMQ
jgi:biopolymer transport protein ExbD